MPGGFGGPLDAAEKEGRKAGRIRTLSKKIAFSIAPKVVYWIC